MAEPSSKNPLRDWMVSWHKICTQFPKFNIPKSLMSVSTWYVSFSTSMRQALSQRKKASTSSKPRKRELLNMATERKDTDSAELLPHHLLLTNLRRLILVPGAHLQCQHSKGGTQAKPPTPPNLLQLLHNLASTSPKNKACSHPHVSCRDQEPFMKSH